MDGGQGGRTHGCCSIRGQETWAGGHRALGSAGQREVHTVWPAAEIAARLREEEGVIVAAH
jgi:hypothetical protein